MTNRGNGPIHRQEEGEVYREQFLNLSKRRGSQAVDIWSGKGAKGAIGMVKGNNHSSA